MVYLKPILGTAIAVSVAGAAAAQTPTFTQAVPTVDTEIVRAQHIRQGDVSPEEYAALLAEADRVRAYQSTSGAYTGVSYSAATSGTIATDNHGYQIEIYDTPTASANISTSANQYPMAKTYPLGTDFSSAEFTSQAATTTYSAPVTYGATTTYAAPTAGTSIVASTPNITFNTSRTTNTSKTTHYVSKGDTLYNIAKRNGVSVTSLKTANNLSGNAISIGQSLTIPGSQRVVTENSQSQSRPTLVRNVEPLPAGNNYAVLPKDTLYSIARRACVSVTDMKAVNGNLDPQSLQPGQRLTLPGGHCMR